MNVLSLDPGITTGYAIGMIEKGEMHVISGEAKWNHAEIYRNLLEDLKPSYIICERFEHRHGNRGRHGVELFPREIIGVVQLYAQMNGAEIRLQMPMKSSPTTYFNDERLKELAVFKSGRGHANDAVRHLLFWAKFKGGSQFVTRIKSEVLA